MINFYLCKRIEENNYKIYKHNVCIFSSELC